MDRIYEELIQLRFFDQLKNFDAFMNNTTVGTRTVNAKKDAF